LAIAAAAASVILRAKMYLPDILGCRASKPVAIVLQFRLIIDGKGANVYGDI
jgi:hypothetical protein